MKIHASNIVEEIFERYGDTFNVKLRSLESNIASYWEILHNHLTFKPTIRNKNNYIKLLKDIFCAYICDDTLIQFSKSMDTVIDINRYQSRYDDDTLKSNLPKSVYSISASDIEWDIGESYNESVESSDDEGDYVSNVVIHNMKSTDDGISYDTIVRKSETLNSTAVEAEEMEIADKSSSIVPEFIDYKVNRDDISLNFWRYPSYDPKDLWGYGKDAAGRMMPIYKTFPKIPEVQRDVSITTNVNEMTDSELMNLYPDHIIRTRRPAMYEKLAGFEFDDVVGFIPKITGFTEDQVLDNIWKYPQFNFMFRWVGKNRYSFMKHIEINGELLTLKQAAEQVDDLKKLPQKKIYFWDYIVRRYLLECEYTDIKHKYPLQGTFSPWMTLFAPPQVYIKNGYTDTLQLAKACVTGRVSFYQTRNPILKEMFVDNE